MVPMVWYVRMLRYGMVGWSFASLAPNLHAPPHSGGLAGMGLIGKGGEIQRKTQIQMQIGIQIPSHLLHFHAPTKIVGQN